MLLHVFFMPVSQFWYLGISLLYIGCLVLFMIFYLLIVHITEIHVVYQWFHNSCDIVHKLIKCWSLGRIFYPTAQHHSKTVRHQCKYACVRLKHRKLVQI